MKLAILALFVIAVVAITVTDAKAAQQNIEPQLPQNIDTLNRDGRYLIMYETITLEKY